MKTFKILILACFVMLGSYERLQAQKIHEIVFCNTIDRSIGHSVEIDNDRALDEIGCIAGYIGYELAEHVFQGSECTRKNLITLLESLKCGPNDVVFFYYSGHGVHANSNFEDKFPQMCMNTNIESQFVPVHLVDEMLAKKKPRLRIIMTDCCNSIDESGVVKPKEGLAMQKGVTIIKNNDQANYKKLFVDSHGSVVMTSSKLGQTSGCNNEIGGFFSYIFWDMLLSECTGNGTPSWQGLLRDVQEVTLSATTSANGAQEPYYVVNLSGSPAYGQPDSTTPPSYGDADDISDSNFSQAVNRLLSTGDMARRMGMIPAVRKTSLQGCKEATVITVGRNLKTVVDYEDIDSYLDRLAANKKIVHVNIIKEKTDSKGKRFFTVTEMRKE